MARFSSGVAPSTSVTCSSQLLPKIVTTGVSASTSARRLGSSSGLFRRCRVEPNAASLADRKVIDRAAAKKSTSFGFEPGQPPSMYGIPNSSRRRAILSLSASETIRPSRCVPSRRVVSYRRIGWSLIDPPPPESSTARRWQPPCLGSRLVSGERPVTRARASGRRRRRPQDRGGRRRGRRWSPWQ